MRSANGQLAWIHLGSVLVSVGAFHLYFVTLRFTAGTAIDGYSNYEQSGVDISLLIMGPLRSPRGQGKKTRLCLSCPYRQRCMDSM